VDKISGRSESGGKTATADHPDIADENESGNQEIRKAMEEENFNPRITRHGSAGFDQGGAGCGYRR